MVVVVERVVFVMGLWVVNCGNCGVSSRDGLTRGGFESRRGDKIEWLHPLHVGAWSTSGVMNVMALRVAN